MPLPQQGVLVRDLNGTQINLVTEIIDQYLETHQPEQATLTRNKINRAGIATIRFAWAGSIRSGQVHYYRLQQEAFLMEFDNSRDQGRHIHSVWRDFTDDFGNNLL